MWIKESRWNREGLEVDLMTEDEVNEYTRHADSAGYPVAVGAGIIQVLAHDESRLIAQFVLAE